MRFWWWDDAFNYATSLASRTGHRQVVRAVPQSNHVASPPWFLWCVEEVRA